MNVVTVLIGNKTDLVDAREVTTDEGKTIAEAQGLFFLETSALDSSNVTTAFHTVVREIYNILTKKVFLSQEHKKQDLTSMANGKTIVLQEDVGEPDNQPKKAGCCS